MKYLIILFLVLPGCVTTRSWTTQEKILLGMSCLAVIADVYTTMADGEINEINPIIGPDPSNGKFIGYMITSQMVTVILAHYVPQYRNWILGLKTGANIGCVFHNMSN